MLELIIILCWFIALGILSWAITCWEEESVLESPESSQDTYTIADAFAEHERMKGELETKDKRN